MTILFKQLRNHTDTHRRAFADALGRGQWFVRTFHASKAKSKTAEIPTSDEDDSDGSDDSDSPPGEFAG